MTTDLRMGLLVIGALLLLGSLLSAVLRRLPRSLRVLAGVAGLGLLVWALLPQLEGLRGASTAGAASEPAASGGQKAATRPDLAFIAASAFTDCPSPPEPAAPPDGTKATRDQMLAAQHMMQAYDAATTAYTRCVDATATSVRAQYHEIASAPELQAVSALDSKVHNSAYDRDRALVDRFNRQLRTFLARQPHTQHSFQSPLPPS